MYSLSSLRRQKSVSPQSTTYKRFAVLVPAYREDKVIHACVHSCLAQDYPADSFDVVVISDHMAPATNASLSALPIRLVEVHFEQSTKSKALNAAMAAIGNDYDIALILDADNIIPSNYLKDVNNIYARPGVEIVQTHRVAKNLNSDMAFLDAVSEEINNSIFRLGHANMGMSAALIGSGMAFSYDLFRDTMANIKAVGGFDRELELTLLYQGKFFHYLPNTLVFDEKVQNTQDFSRQRRRWLSAQWHYFTTFSRYTLMAISRGNWDFCDKMFQQLSMPRVLLLGFTFLIAVGFSFFNAALSIKWWVLFLLLALALIVSIPRNLFKSRILTALLKLPYAFCLMAANLFKLRGANKRFIHTAHGVADEKG